ncbi:MAG: WXG100 family type VII secretion target [Actinomycetia bacterium]|nr:WXG100 family type VII secretion target [Actinomycetes bacterium]
MSFVGMSVDAIDRAATTLRAQGEELDSIRQQVDRLVNEAGAHWDGTDVRAFRSAWSSSLAPRMRSGSSHLSDMAQYLTRQAAEQRQASAAHGGSAPGGGLGVPVLPADDDHTDPPVCEVPWSPLTLRILNWAGNADNVVGASLAGWAMSQGRYVMQDIMNFKPVTRYMSESVDAAVKAIQKAALRLFPPVELENWAMKPRSLGGALKGATKGVAVVGWAITAASVGIDAYTQWTKDSCDPTLSTGAKVVRAATTGIADNAPAIVGALAGAKLGAMAGAAIGSLFPGPGTVVGTVVGGLVGGVIGSGLAQVAYDAVADTVHSWIDRIRW